MFYINLVGLSIFYINENGFRYLFWRMILFFCLSNTLNKDSMNKTIGSGRWS